ncbi:PucR family transcriptional regulator, partial [Bacillus pumilus]
MLAKLKRVYGKHNTSSSTNAHQTLWYQTHKSEFFGVDTSDLTTRESLLLNTFLTPIYLSHTKQPEDKHRWYCYLFDNKPLTVQHPVRVYYFKISHQAEQRQQIKEAVVHSLEHAHFI